MSISDQIRHLHRLADGQKEAIDAELALFGAAWRPATPADPDVGHTGYNANPTRPLFVLETHGVRACLFLGSSVGHCYVIGYQGSQSAGRRKTWGECYRDASIDVLMAIDRCIENATLVLSDFPAPDPS